MKQRLVAVATAVSGTLVAGVLAAAPAEAASWSSVGSNCVSGGVSGWTKYTRCWEKKKLSSDGNGSRDYFSLRMTISANSTDGKWLKRTWVEPYPSGGSAQSWEGADPFQPDRTVSSSSDCVQNTWTVGGGNIPISFSTTSSTCSTESFGPKLYAAHGHHAGIWSASNCVAAGVVRKAHAGVSVRVVQGGTATWGLDRYGAGAYSSRSSC